MHGFTVDVTFFNTRTRRYIVATVYFQAEHKQAARKMAQDWAKLDSTLTNRSNCKVSRIELAELAGKNDPHQGYANY